GGDPRRFFATQEQTVATAEECLRFDAPLHMFRRYAYDRTEIAPGVTGNAGEQNVTFGGGIHFCIGAPLARLELQVALKVLFDRLPGLKFADAPRYRDT